MTGPRRSRRWVSACHISHAERETRGCSSANNTWRTRSLTRVWGSVLAEIIRLLMRTGRKISDRGPRGDGEMIHHDANSCAFVKNISHSCSIDDFPGRVRATRRPVRSGSGSGSGEPSRLNLKAAIRLINLFLAVCRVRRSSRAVVWGAAQIVYIRKGRQFFAACGTVTRRARTND